MLQQDRAGTGTLASASRDQAVARAALLLKLSHLSSAGASLAVFAPAVVHRHLRRLMTVSCVPKGAKQWPVVWPCCPPCSCLRWEALQGCLCLSGWQRPHCHLIGILFSLRGRGWLPLLFHACNPQHVPLQYHTACDLSCWPAGVDPVPLGVLSAVLSSGLFFKLWLSV